MNTGQLEALVALAETGSFRKAGERLMLTPPGVKHVLDSLEGEIGLTLFERTRTGTKLTASGKVFIEHVRVALDELSKGISLAMEQEPREHTELFAPYLSMPTIACNVFPQAFEAFTQAHPEITFNFKRVKSMAGVNFDVVNGNVGPVHIPAIAHRLTTLPLSCVVGMGSPLRTRTSVALDELASYRLLVPPPHLIELMDSATQRFLTSQDIETATIDQAHLDGDPQLVDWLLRPNHVAILLDYWKNHEDTTSFARYIPIENAGFEYNIYTNEHPNAATRLYVSFIQDYYATHAD